MPKRPARFRPFGGTVADDARAYERERGTASERGYDARWAKASLAHRAKYPLCQYCELGKVTRAATLTDHLYPHRGDREVFWLACWWVSSCTSCHSSFKQGVERQGYGAIDALARRLGRPIWADRERLTARG